MSFPDSRAMDATASYGGPSSLLPQIYTASPEQIFGHVDEIRKIAAEFTGLMTGLTRAAEQLDAVWSGAASESALRTIADSIAALAEIIEVVRAGADLLDVSGALLDTAQEAYRAVVSTVNPVVAAMMSSPSSRGAAEVLSTVTTVSLRAFLRVVGDRLDALGSVDLTGQVSRLAAVVGEIEKLSGVEPPGGRIRRELVGHFPEVVVPQQHAARRGGTE
ncbi:WXG100 family type VII secretion target [Amycolatopsis nigrescens]|uniref:WXG100 family type VII secretion target n=1 Tax=Amycolatopsis nigrescens TaxID=381445 RepID=UPI000367F07D|nr:hypothetical protein [Amycolatopsis nigrescens]